MKLAGTIVVLSMLVACVPVRAAEPVRIAFIEPLSGPFANVAVVGVRQLQMEMDVVNARGGVLGRPLELVALDGKGSTQEALIQLQAALDQGTRFIAQASGSHVAHALNEAIAKHNARNPDRPVLFLNLGSLDPTLTGERCQFWMFRLVPDGRMMLAALTEVMAPDPAIKRVYLVNQDYAWGHSVAKLSKEILRTRRPDVEVVGEELHPLGKIKDFAPYVAKIAAAHADTIITGNWGNDLSLLVRSAKEAGAGFQFYAPLAGLTGTPAAIGNVGESRVHAVHFWHSNDAAGSYLERALAFRSKWKDDCCWFPDHLLPVILVEAMNKARSVDPLDVAQALEGLRYDGPTGPVWIRPEDHQAVMPVYATVFAKVGSPGVKYEAEGTGFGWRTEVKMDAKDVAPPLTCRVQRPSH